MGQQLAAGTTVSSEFIGQVLTQWVVFLDIASKSEGDQNKLSTQMALEVGGIKETITKQQGVLELLAKGQGSGDRSHQPRGILESKAVGGLSNLGSDKTAFRIWNEKLINAVSQVRYGSRKLFRAMMDYVDQEAGGNFEDDFQDSDKGKEMEAGGTSYDRMDEDLYTLLMDKTEGEAALRVRGCNPGQGVRAYMVIYK